MRGIALFLKTSKLRSTTTQPHKGAYVSTDANTTTKLCRHCLLDLPTSDFYKNHRNADGLSSYCKVCASTKGKAYHKSEKGQEKYKLRMESGYTKTGKAGVAILRAGAAARNLECTITPDELTTWWQETPNTCHYCGSTIKEYIGLRDAVIAYGDNGGKNYEILKFLRFFKGSKQRAIQHMTFDRRDNKKGYTLDNIVKACWICNNLKGAFLTEEQMQLIGPWAIHDLWLSLNNER